MPEDQRPNLSLPEVTAGAPPRQGGRGLGVLAIALLVAVLVLQVMGLRRPEGRR